VTRDLRAALDKLECPHRGLQAQGWACAIDAVKALLAAEPAAPAPAELTEKELREVLSHCIYDQVDYPRAVAKLNKKLRTRRPVTAREEAKEQLATWMIKHSFATGHGDTFEDLLKELNWQIAEIRNAARLTALQDVKGRYEKDDNGSAPFEDWLTAEIRDLKSAATAAQGKPAITVTGGALPGCTADAIRESGKWKTFEQCRAECYEGGTGGRVHYCGREKGHEGNCRWDLEGK